MYNLIVVSIVYIMQNMKGSKQADDKTVQKQAKLSPNSSFPDGTS